MKNRTTKSRGFALVLVLSLLAILVLVTYALSTVSKVSGAISSATSYQTQARQNALVAMRLAIGKLQKAAGRDDVVTGMAGLAGIQPSASSRTRYWCGVWDSNGDFVSWLVSGDVGPISIGGTTSVSLVGANTVGLETGTSLLSTTNSRETEHVEVPMVEIKNSGGQTTGRIAYWVGDEGTKISVYVPADEAPSPLGIAVISDKLSTERPRGLWDVTRSLSQTQLESLISYEHLIYAGGGVTATDIKEPFHYLTLRARSVEGAGFVSGRVNINSASRPLWYSIVSTYNLLAAGSQLSQVASVGRKIADAMDSGPFTSLEAFENSSLLDDALPASVSPSVFVQTLNGILITRSDTFRIRAYGDAMNPADADDPNAKPEAVAYCEAIVQRTPEVIDSLNGPLGRRFVITYFRWLGPDDI